MIGFILGVLVTIIINWLILKFNVYNIKTYLEESKLIYKDIKELTNNCISLSDKLVDDLEKKINEVHEVLELLEEKKKEKKTSVAVTKPVTESKGQGIKLSFIHNSILELAEKGYTIKEISQKLGIGRDQVTMVLQLYKKS